MWLYRRKLRSVPCLQESVFTAPLSQKLLIKPHHALTAPAATSFFHIHCTVTFFLDTHSSNNAGCKGSRVVSGCLSGYGNYLCDILMILLEYVILCSCMAVWNDSKAFLKLRSDTSVQKGSMIFYATGVGLWEECRIAVNMFDQVMHIMCSHVHCDKYIEESEKTVQSAPKQTTWTCPKCVV